MKHYVYKTTNLLNNKIYIGYHHSNDIDSDNYLGSGDAIMRAIKRYGKNNFIREILFEFDNQNDAYLKERELVNEAFVRNRDTYNMKIGGKGWEIGRETHNKNKITIYSPITNKNYYVSENELQGFLDDGYILGNKSKGNRLCIKMNDVIRYINPNDFDQYEKNGWSKSNTTDGKVCLTHIKTNKLKYVNEIDVDLYINNGYVIGNLKSGVNKGTIYINKNGKNKRISVNILNEYLSDGWEQKRIQKELKIKRMYNLETGLLKNIPIELVDEFISQGWSLGVNYSSVKNAIHVTKDDKTIRISGDNIDKYLKDGWSLFKK